MNSWSIYLSSELAFKGIKLKASKFLIIHFFYQFVNTLEISLSLVENRIEIIETLEDMNYLLISDLKHSIYSDLKL
jgi:hypothetical protein